MQRGPCAGREEDVAVLTAVLEFAVVVRVAADKAPIRALHDVISADDYEIAQEGRVSTSVRSFRRAKERTSVVRAREELAAVIRIAADECSVRAYCATKKDKTNVLENETE